MVANHPYRRSTQTTSSPLLLLCETNSLIIHERKARQMLNKERTHKYTRNENIDITDEYILY